VRESIPAEEIGALPDHPDTRDAMSCGPILFRSRDPVMRRESLYVSDPGEEESMRSTFTVGRRALLLWFCLLAAVVATEAQAGTQEYTPTEGQPGKDVIWLPTKQTLVDIMLDLAKVTPQDYVIDLGSGDGRTVIAAAKRGTRALGIEYNPDLVELSKRTAITEGVGDKVNFIAADIFETDFSQGTVITMFLLPQLNLKLRPQILALKPGTRVVSNTFTMGDWEPDGKGEMPASASCSDYCTALLWIVPAQVEGTWSLVQGQLTLSQTYQMLSGTLDSDGKNAPIVKGKLMGDEIAFSVGETSYTGRVNGDLMQGTFRSAAGTGTWSAVRTGKR
jgi:SAM-dependent methyltransferase